MERFKWIGEDREISPNKENYVLVDTIEKVIERIASIHNFKTMFEGIGLKNFYSEKQESAIDYFKLGFQKYLEKSFVAVRRGNTMGMTPPLMKWTLQFDDIMITIPKEEGIKLLSENFSYYKHRLEFYHECGLKQSVFYDLSQDKFNSYL